ncbi:hypothetical protein [Pseudomonas sp. DNDY-54]|uniref:hypothetical protein n=1 Tax=Pseudomonas sp. DNDY-54 TaxID=2870860 RepID=UPI001CA42280|nr:hypothetical protein [Pseudomonas sp. DNDY-54]
MKIRFLVLSGILIASFASFWVYGNSVIAIGERESRWILQDMWGSSYFYARMEGLNEHERINLLSLREGSSKNQELIDHVMKNKCTDDSVRCYLVMTSASNLLIDAREYDSGLRGMVEAIDRVSAKEFCPIAYESAIIRYKIEVMSSKDSWSARRSSIDVLEKIKANNGFIKSLKTETCTRLAREKPKFFHEYTMLVAHIMVFAGGDYAKAGAYIDSLRNNEG